MRSSPIEAIIGAIVLVVAAVFLIFAYQTTDLRSSDGYRVYAEFDRIDGLSVGADVRISGIKVGRVASQRLEREYFTAMVELDIDKNVRLPADSSASVATEGLLGGTYIDLQPGAMEEMLGNGDMITRTEGAVDIMSLVKRAVMSPANNP